VVYLKTTFAAATSYFRAAERRDCDGAAITIFWSSVMLKAVVRPAFIKPDGTLPLVFVYE